MAKSKKPPRAPVSGKRHGGGPSSVPGHMKVAGNAPAAPCTGSMHGGGPSTTPGSKGGY